eukprot:gene14830-biopygen10490
MGGNAKKRRSRVSSEADSGSSWDGRQPRRTSARGRVSALHAYAASMCAPTQALLQARQMLIAADMCRSCGGSGGAAFIDAQRAMGLLRSRAAALRLNASKARLPPPQPPKAGGAGRAEDRLRRLQRRRAPRGCSVQQEVTKRLAARPDLPQLWIHHRAASDLVDLAPVFRVVITSSKIWPLCHHHPAAQPGPAPSPARGKGHRMDEEC